MGDWRVLVALGCLTIAVSCVESASIQCADGRVCGPNTTCVDELEICALPEQIAGCDGLADGDNCSFVGTAGRCTIGVCIGSTCGNGELDLGEVCDDGNAVSGDGCRGDCGKAESCSDGIVDEGEACDDGNANPIDSCDACAVTSWSVTTPIAGSLVATSTPLVQPEAVASDDLGNIYIVDEANHQVLKLTPGGQISVFAGTTAEGSSGDDGPAVAAQLSRPKGVAVDGLGNVYVADTGVCGNDGPGHRIRRISPAGTITTIAGTGIAGSTGDGGLATSATLRCPRGVVVDGLGNVLIADSGNYRIRRIDTAGVITTLAGSTPGTGANQFASLYQLALDPQRNLYVADLNRVRKLTPAGVLTTIAGTGGPGSAGDGGLATAATLNGVRGIAIDGQGRVVIGDSLSYRIRRIDANGIITRIAGTTMGFSGDGGDPLAAQMKFPNSLAIIGDDIVFVDGQNMRVRRIAGGLINTIAGTASVDIGDGGLALATVVYPLGLAVDAAGNIYLADWRLNRVRRVDAQGIITTVAGTGAAGSMGDGGPATAAQLNRPRKVALDGAGNLYIVEQAGNRVRKVTNGIITTVAGTGTAGFSGDGGSATLAMLDDPQAVAVDVAGNVYIADSRNNRIRRVTAGTITTIAGTGVPGSTGDGGDATAALLYEPRGVHVDASGSIYVADSRSYVVRKISGGIINRIAGTIDASGYTGDGGAATSATLTAVEDVAVDPLGRVVIADLYNRVIRRIAQNGTITTIAGTSAAGFSGDGGPATSAIMHNVSSIAIDATGAVYIGDAENDAVRRLDPTSGIITTVAGPIDPSGGGPIVNARLATPTAMIVTPLGTWFAGGTSGTVQRVRPTGTLLETVVGRYPHAVATGTLARFRAQTFGTVGGVAFDPVAQRLYLSERGTHQIHVVTLVDPTNHQTWTIAPLANTTGTAGFADGPSASAMFRDPTNLLLVEGTLYVVDTGNHVIRAIDLSTQMVTTVAGTPQARGMYGDGGAATGAKLFGPEAITRCENGDLFVADTGNNRIRRVAAGTNIITTVLGIGAPASTGEGQPARGFPVDRPRGLACDAAGNLYVTSTTAIRLLPHDGGGIVDGTGEVLTIYGREPRDTFPASVTSSLTGITAVDATTTQFVDSATGLLVELVRVTN